MPTKTPTIHRMHYAVFLTRQHAHHQSMPPPEPSVVKIDELEDNSHEFLLGMFAQWLKTHQPEPTDQFDIRVRARVDNGLLDVWKRDDWRRATETVRFSQLDGSFEELKRIDPIAVAWAAGNDDPYAAVEDE